MMRSEKRQFVVPYYGIIKLMLSGLYKLPLVIKPVLLRGVKRDLSDQYKVGEVKVWWPFSSTTVHVNTLENPQFMGKTGPRTLFQIINAPAIDIKPYSANKHEEEWLLLPGTCLTVRSVTKLENGLVNIMMEFEAMPPLIDFAHPQWPKL
jgi:hypothetical protein